MLGDNMGSNSADYFYCLDYDAFLFMKDVLIIVNRVDPDKMQHYAHYIWVFTICQSTRLGVSSVQKG